jgi:RHS repeat-associated protein
LTTWARAGGYAGSNYTFLTQKERDIETGLDYFEARYFSSVQGRFTGVDPLTGSAKPEMPQSWNRYSYCINNPLLYIDPSGLIWGQHDLGNGRLEAQWFDSEDDLKKAGEVGRQ